MPFEYGGSMRGHAVTARPEAQGGKRTVGDVFVNALAAHFPVRRELRDRDISGRVSLEIDDGWHDVVVRWPMGVRIRAAPDHRLSKTAHSPYCRERRLQLKNCASDARWRETLPGAKGVVEFGPQ